MFKIRYPLHDNYINNFPLIFTDKIYTYITYCLQSKGPLFIKIGQFLSSKQDFLPRDLIKKLTILQDANPCELPNYKSVIVRPERLDLLHLLGSGSIGTVFKCIFTSNSSLDGSSNPQLCAIKFKHRDLNMKLKGDKQSLDKYLGYLDYINYLPGSWLKELKSSIINLRFFITPLLITDMCNQENFKHEAEIQMRAYTILKSYHEFVIVPKVIKYTEDYIIQSYETGISLEEVRDTYGQEVAIQAFALLESTYFNLIRNNGFVHNDMHSGNFKFRITSSNKIKLIIYDYGYCKLLDLESWEYIRKIIGKGNVPDLRILIESIKSDHGDDAKWDNFQSEINTLLDHPSIIYAMNGYEKFDPSTMSTTDIMTCIEKFWENRTEFAEMYNGHNVSLSSIMKSLISLLIKYRYKIEENLLSIIFNMTYMIDYSNAYICNLDDTMKKMYHVKIYDHLYCKLIPLNESIPPSV